MAVIHAVPTGNTSTRTGVQAETPLLGLKLGLLDGVELHFIGFTLGIDTWPLAIKTPLALFGLLIASIWLVFRRKDRRQASRIPPQ